MRSSHNLESSLSGVGPLQSRPGDAQLLQASQHGDQDAFALLVQRHQRRVFNLSLGLLQDEEDASEITQEAFVVAWQGLPGFRGGEAGFPTWLYRIAYRCCLRPLARRTRVHARHSAITENENGMHTSGQFHTHARGQNSSAVNQEAEDFSQQQRAWVEQRQNWLEQQHSALEQADQ